MSINHVVITQMPNSLESQLDSASSQILSNPEPHSPTSENSSNSELGTPTIGSSPNYDLDSPTTEDSLNSELDCSVAQNPPNSQADCSEKWSEHQKNYNQSTGDAYTLAFDKLVFETHVFSLIDEMLCARKGVLDVLILACGTGAEADILTDRYDETQLRIIATDFSEAMVAATKTLIEKKGKSNMVQTEKMDACNITLEDSSVDVVILFFGPMLLPDPARGFSEILRVLRPKGFSAYVTQNKLDMFEVLDRAKSLVIEERAPSLSEEERWQGISFRTFYETPMMLNWGKLEAVVEKVENAGFQDVEGRVLDISSTYTKGEDLSHLVRHLLSHPVLSQLFQATFTESEKEAFGKYIPVAMEEKWPGSLVIPKFSGNVVWGYKN